MKKTLFILAAAALAFSCTKEIAPETTTPAGEKVTIRVSIPEEPLSKVSLTEAADHQSIALAWEAGDNISVNGEVFTIKDGFSAHEAEFEGNEPSGTSYIIIYPGKYTSVEAAYARSYEGQVQTGNSSTAHLEFNAALAGVSEYAAPKFDPEWAADKGGQLLQNSVLQMRLQLPDGVTTASSVSLIASRAIFPTTNAGTTLSKEMTLALNDVTLPANHILEAFMMVSAAGVTIQDGDELTIAVDTPEAMYLRTITLSAQTWTGGGQYTLQLKVQDENTFDINNVNDLFEFQEGVNSGSIVWQKVHANLKADLDLSSVSTWTPIGNGTFVNANPYTVSGNTFRGVFDGGSHVLKNFQISGAPADNAPYGFFGILDGATVKDLVFGAASGDNGFFKVTPVGVMEAGIVAGLSRGSTIKNVTNYSPMSILENTSTGAAYFGMVGYVWGTSAGRSHLDNVDNYGEINAVPGGNTANGGTGVQVAGIAGFSNTANSSVKNLIENCDNYGNLTTSTGRTAGILAAANTRTTLSGCVNRGNILNTCANARMAGVCVILGDGSSMVDCSNYGDVVVTKSDTHVGGLVCLINNASITISGGGNHGLIVGDIATYRGTLVANINTFSSISGMVAGGTVASYNGGDYQYVVLTEDNYMNYIGKVKTSSDMSKITNITFEAWNGYPAGNETLISNAADLVAFAAKVNAGEFAASDVAKLTADIDCSSITDWTPIGAGTFSWASNHLTISTGHPFEGTFNGNGKTIKNLDQSYTVTTAGGAYGFFGMLADGAVIKDLTFDSDCSLSVTASASGDFGVLAGLVQGATIKNITSNASISGGATNSLGANRVTMGILGFAFTNGVEALIESVVNRGNLSVVNGNNTNNGASGVQCAGILGFGTNDVDSTKPVNVKSCNNYGNMTGDVARLSGIVAAANRYTVITGCKNYGKQVNTASHSNKTRVGNITCITGTGSQLINCINMGDIIANGTCQPGGVIGMPNHASNVFNGCENYGKIVAASDIVNKGTLFGYCNNASSFSNCVAGGDLGTYVDGVNDTMVGVNAENYSQYWGYKGTNATNVTTANITWKAAPSE